MFYIFCKNTSIRWRGKLAIKASDLCETNMNIRTFLRSRKRWWFFSLLNECFGLQIENSWDFRSDMRLFMGVCLLDVRQFARHKSPLEGNLTCILCFCSLGWAQKKGWIVINMALISFLTEFFLFCHVPWCSFLVIKCAWIIWRKKILLHLIPTCGRFRCPDVLINWLQVMLETCLDRSEQVVPHISEFHTTT